MWLCVNSQYRILSTAFHSYISNCSFKVDVYPIFPICNPFYTRDALAPCFSEVQWIYCHPSTTAPLQFSSVPPASPQGGLQSFIQTGGLELCRRHVSRWLQKDSVMELEHVWHGWGIHWAGRVVGSYIPDNWIISLRKVWKTFLIFFHKIIDKSDCPNAKVRLSPKEFFFLSKSCIKEKRS